MTELPTTFGKYYLTEKLATGGMAEIFLGKLIGPGGFEKQLVIKQIHPALSGQRHFVDLFVAEAKTLVGLAHGNIVPLYELGVIDDTYFIAMEYIDGPTLWRLTEAVFRKQDALDPGLALHVAAELAKGLDYAHRKGGGVIHRDLSPRNVMLSRDGEVKLVDFGIAVTFGGGEGPSDDSMPTGSFPYMSPEQVARRPLTGQSDLFSLGVLLWEMLTGERLFTRGSADETLAAVTGAEIPAPSSRRAAVPAAFDALVLRCLERDPAKRWGDAGELLSALNRVLYSLEVVPGARDVAAAVARYCPPVSQYVPEPIDSTEPSSPFDGPSTQVMGGSHPRGKRKPTIREASFATHVDFEKVLGRATPMVPLRAILDDDGPRTVVKPTAAPEPGPVPVPVHDLGGASSTAMMKPAGLAVWRWVLLVAAAFAALAVLGWMLVRGKPTDPAAHPDATEPADATALVAPPLDAAAPDAAGPPDAGRRPDAGPPRTAPDANAARTTPDAGTSARSGTLKVGADPWGEVFLDGRRLGRAPNAWDVPAGRHQVEVVFPSDEGELRRRFDVTIGDGGSESVFADFTP